MAYASRQVLLVIIISLVGWHDIIIAALRALKSGSFVDVTGLNISPEWGLICKLSLSTSGTINNIPWYFIK